MLAVAWPSWAWTALTLAPWAISSDAQVWRRSLRRGGTPGVSMFRPVCSGRQAAGRRCRGTGPEPTVAPPGPPVSVRTGRGRPLVPASPEPGWLGPSPPDSGTEPHPDHPPGAAHGASPARPHWCLGQYVLPGGDDVRWLGQHRPRPQHPDHPPGPGRRDQLHRHRRRLRPGRVRADPRQGPGRGPPRRRHLGHQGPWRDGPGPQPARHLPALDHPRGRGLAAAAGHRLDRPVPGPPLPARHRPRGDPGRPQRPRPPGQGPLPRPLPLPASAIVEAQWAARDRGLERYVTEQPPYSILVRAIETEVLPTCTRYGMGVLSDSPLTGGWLSGRWRKASGQQSSSRANRLPERFDLSRPTNQHKLDAVEELAQLAEQGGSPPSSSRSRSSSATPPSPQRSSGPGPWSSWSASSPQPRWSWTRRCWTASTSSSRPAASATTPLTPILDGPARSSSLERGSSAQPSRAIVRSVT